MALLFCGCSKTSNKTLIPSKEQFQREVYLDWCGYRINTEKAIAELNLKITVESELMAYCDFFKNVADTNIVNSYILMIKSLIEKFININFGSHLIIN